MRKTFTVADSGFEIAKGNGLFENGRTDSDGAWDFKPIFVDSQTLDFRVERARWQA